MAMVRSAPKLVIPFLLESQLLYMDKAVNQMKLQSLKEAPTIEDLVGVMRLAAQRPTTAVCLPFVTAKDPAGYSISAIFGPKGGEPKWVVTAGIDPAPIAVHISGDVALIHELVVVHCGGAPSAQVDDFNLKQSTALNKLPKAAIPSIEVADPSSSWLKLRNKAANTAAQRLSQPMKVYDPREAEQLRLLESRAQAEDRPSPTEIDRNANVLVGDLLVAAELISREELHRLMPLARQTGLPIGRILVESGVLTESLVRASVMAQSLLRDKLLHFQLAVKALKKTAELDITYDTALKELGWHEEYYEISNKLGKLLVDAQAVTEDQLAGANEVCFASGLPLGRVLVLRKVIPEVVAYAALSVQVLLREGKIARQEAVKVITDSAGINSSVQDWLTQDRSASDGRGNAVRLGELLILAGIISELDLLSTVESSLTQKIMIGQVLVNSKIVSQSLLDQVLKLQKAVNSQLLSSAEAARMIREMHHAPPKPVATERQISEPQRHADAELTTIMKKLGASNTDELKNMLQTILQQKENLAYRLVSEQEELKHKLARDLHDTIIADVLMLKRYLSGDKQLSVEQIIEILDYIVLQMREICNDFVPKQLQDWGLKPAVIDLVERVGRRSGMESKTHCTSEIKKLPEPVQLHIFRILQEWVNNVEKYASATKLDVSLEESPEGVLRLMIVDNGKGFNSADPVDSRTSQGGRGIQNLKERVELIRCYFNARLVIDSKPGAGSWLDLQIKTR
jgi:signal transduction histidine kinase